MEAKNLTEVEVENIRIQEVLDAAVRWMPYRDVIQEIADMPQEERENLADPSTDAPYDEFLQVSPKSLTPRQYEFVKGFFHAFAASGSAEHCLAVMKIQEDVWDRQMEHYSLSDNEVISIHPGK